MLDDHLTAAAAGARARPTGSGTADGASSGVEFGPPTRGFSVLVAELFADHPMPGH